MSQTESSAELLRSLVSRLDVLEIRVRALETSYPALQQIQENRHKELKSLIELAKLECKLDMLNRLGDLQQRLARLEARG